MRDSWVEPLFFHLDIDMSILILVFLCVFAPLRPVFFRGG